MMGMMTSGILFFLVQVACLAEFYHMCTGRKWTSYLPALVGGSIVFAMVALNQDGDINVGYFAFWVIPAVLLFFSSMVFYQSEHFVRDMAIFISGWVYISASLGLFARVGHMIFDPNNKLLIYFNGNQILTVFILVWISDTFAYLVGRKWGKHPLASKISPKKTVEGFVGGAIFTVPFSILLSHIFPFMATIHFVMLAILVVIFGNLGDLFESKIKRSLNIKDSGTRLGGHGGFLDRFDSILFAGPACYFYLVHFILM